MSSVPEDVFPQTSKLTCKHQAHLPSLIASPNYEIVALANSTVESAQASIEHHKLGPSVKAYGNPADIANDPDVDLVLCSVAVAKHYEYVSPKLSSQTKP